MSVIGQIDHIIKVAFCTHLYFYLFTKHFFIFRRLRTPTILVQCIRAGPHIFD